jgi:hypothetical protein
VSVHPASATTAMAAQAPVNLWIELRMVLSCLMSRAALAAHCGMCRATMQCGIQFSRHTTIQAILFRSNNLWDSASAKGGS